MFVSSSSGLTLAYKITNSTYNIKGEMSQTAGGNYSFTPHICYFDVDLNINKIVSNGVLVTKEFLETLIRTHEYFSTCTSVLIW